MSLAQLKVPFRVVVFCCFVSSPMVYCCFPWFTIVFCLFLISLCFSIPYLAHLQVPFRNVVFFGFVMLPHGFLWFAVVCLRCSSVMFCCFLRFLYFPIRSVFVHHVSGPLQSDFSRHGFLWFRVVFNVLYDFKWFPLVFLCSSHVLSSLSFSANSCYFQHFSGPSQGALSRCGWFRIVFNGVRCFSVVSDCAQRFSVVFISSCFFQFLFSITSLAHANLSRRDFLRFLNSFQLRSVVFGGFHKFSCFPSAVVFFITSLVHVKVPFRVVVFFGLKWF